MAKGIIVVGFIIAYYILLCCKCDDGVHVMNQRGVRVDGVMEGSRFECLNQS